MKISDFGLARLVDADRGQTRSGVILGTPATFASNGAGLGNALLKPERSGELEGGFDLGLFGNRMSLEAT